MKKYYFLLTILLTGVLLAGCESKESSSVVEESSVKAEEPSVEAEEIPVETDDDSVSLVPGVYQYKYEEEMDGETQLFYNYIVVKEDNTGYWEIQDLVPIVWDDKKITLNDNDYEYTVGDACITVKEEFGDNTYNLLDEIAVDEYLENWNNPEYKFYIEGMKEIKSSFVEEKADKTEFKDYDELISYLEKGQGYAYIQLQGYDGELLVISKELYDDGDGEQVAMEAVVYGVVGGKVQYLTVAVSDGTARPIAVNDGVLVYAHQHEVGGDFLNPDATGIMSKFYAYESFEDGEASYSGFFRDTNSFDEDNQREVDTEEAYYELYQVYLDGDPIVFTVVE